MNCSLLEKEIPKNAFNNSSFPSVIENTHHLHLQTMVNNLTKMLMLTSFNMLIILKITVLTRSNGYDKICPHSSQWNFTSRSYRCADQKIYICLFDLLKSYSTNKTVFTETCGPEDVSREGSKYILNPNLEQVSCNAIQYQPFTFKTNGNSQCALSRSLCKSSGQILASNGSSFSDTSCRCDYTRSFDYIIPPKDQCSCKPAEEDCSCYIRKCDDDKVMIADYRCVTRVKTILPEDIKCPIISRIIPPEETDAVDKNQFLPFLSSRTWSKQASVFLMVGVLIYAVLIGFLFFSVPYVQSILLKSELELSLKRKENEFVILNRDNVKIECNVKSYIRIRSVTWHKEINGIIIQITSSEEKYKMDFGQRPSLTINDFNAEDQGKYRCIVSNAVGLRNEMFVSCTNFKSRIGWLTGFVSVLQHIPAFHTEDMTLHSHDFDSKSKPTVYNAYKGDYITMEPHYDDQQKLKAVKWFKKIDKWTELLLSNEQFSGGVPDVPSLTIETTRIGNAGKYLNMLIDDNGETKTSLFELKIIPQVKIYKALCEHREDKTFMLPAICETINQQMQENNIVVITGREGTGKSKICLEIASFYEQKDFTVWKVDLSENYTLYTDMVDTLLIIDDQQYTHDSLNGFMELLLPVLLERNIKVLLTCRNLDLEIVKIVPGIHKLKGDAIIDINNCLTAEEKEKMLRRYMKENNIATSAANASNFRDPEIVSDLSLQVTLDEDAIKVIKNEEPWKGFPMSLSLFCSDRNCLHLGEKYFTNPPIYLLEELKELYKTARKTSNCMGKINDYCILVYIMNNNDHQLDLNDHNLCSQLNKLYETLFRFKYIPKKSGSNEDQKKAIEEALHRMSNKYLKFHEGVYKFIHSCVLKAMFLSSDYAVNNLLQNGALHDITEFVRSDMYTALENELVIKIDENYHHILCERLVRHAFDDHFLLQHVHVAQYIYSYWRSLGNNLVYTMFKHIEFVLFRSLEVHTGDLPSVENESLSEESTKLEESVQFFKIIMLVDKLTNKGRDPWIYGTGTSDFLILSGIVSAAMGKYAANGDQTYKILLGKFQNWMHLESFAELSCKPLDKHGNTFFHYLMLFSENEASNILYTIEARKYVFNTENVKEYTPLDIAAYLGKRNILEVFKLKTSITRKLRYRLKRLAESGKAEWYAGISINKNTQETNDDNASPEKLECKNAEDEKKEAIGENKKKHLKRIYSHRNEELNKKEKHEKMNVLCFEDFMINILVLGKIADYQSIIELLSK